MTHQKLLCLGRVRGVIFLSEVGFSHFSKVAVVTDKKWLNKIVAIEDKLFKNIDMKGFPIEEKDKAIEFLKAP